MLEPNKYGPTKKPFDEFYKFEKLVTDVRNAILESEYDYILNMPEFYKKEKSVQG